MERQPILAETLRQHFQHPPGVRFTGETHDNAVRITDEQSTTPQPRFDLLLANVHLPYVLDVWFEQQVKPRLRGRALLIRYAARE